MIVKITGLDRNPAAAPDPEAQVRLRFHHRQLRRKALRASNGDELMIDLPRGTRLDDGDRLLSPDGRSYQVVAQQEPLIEIRGGDRARIALHIGQRRVLCQVEDERFVIQADAALQAVARDLGAEVQSVTEYFDPERIHVLPVRAA